MTEKTRIALEIAQKVLATAAEHVNQTRSVAGSKKTELKILKAFNLVTAALYQDETVLAPDRARSIDSLAAAVASAGGGTGFDKLLEAANKVVYVFSPEGSKAAGRMPATDADKTETDTTKDLEKRVDTIENQIRLIEKDLNVVTCESDDTRRLRDVLVRNIRIGRGEEA